MPYLRTIPVEFNHCDPAGIVFYPRYFEMTNSMVENFFADVLDYPYARVAAEHRGVPTVRIETDFHAPSRLGDKVEWRLEITRIGTTSVQFLLQAGDPARLTARLTLVWLTPQGRPEPWPEDVRRKMTAFVEGNAQ